MIVRSVDPGGGVAAVAGPAQLVATPPQSAISQQQQQILRTGASGDPTSIPDVMLWQCGCFVLKLDTCY